MSKIKFKAKKSFISFTENKYDSKEIESTILKTLKYQISFVLIALYFLKVTKNTQLKKMVKKGSTPVE